MSNSFKSRQTLNVNGQKYTIFNLKTAEKNGLGDLSKLPFSLKILLENLLRHEDNHTVTETDIKAIAEWLKICSSKREIAYRPARVLMQDFTGVPAVVDLAAMRDAMKKLGGNPNKINPLSAVDLVIDHSVQVNSFATSHSFEENVKLEMKDNQERYEFLRWGQTAFKNFRVVPPGTGICHQVNLEYLAKVIWSQDENGEHFAYPDTLVGTDSHTTMINGLGVLGWGVGGIEAEAAMLGQPISMLIPDVVGFKLIGKLREGITATDLVLTVTQMLRAHGVVDKFVEFYGEGLSELDLANRATISNMAPEYGATCGFFPIDTKTIDYLKLSGRDEHVIALVEAYAKEQGLWHDESRQDPAFTSQLSLDLSKVEPSLAGPKRPQDRVAMSALKEATQKVLTETNKHNIGFNVQGENYEMHHGDVVIAAITSCTNTSNPSVMLAAGLVAKKALEKGLQRKPWVKSSLAPGSKVVTEYFEKTGLQTYLDQLGFNLVGYGCTTCIGNSGPLPDAITKTINDNDLTVSAVLSGNRNFEGRVHPLVKCNWLASPPLVVCYALAGTTLIDLDKDPLGYDKANKPVFLKDIWPSNAEIEAVLAKINGEMFRKEYADVFKGTKAWQEIATAKGETYSWNNKSTYVQNPPYFENLSMTVTKPKNIKNAAILALFGDSITTDHISPAGSFKKDSPAGKYLIAHGVDPIDFNSYGARRGNHEVMMRGTFANIRIRNEMTPEIEGGYSKYLPTGETLSIYDAAMKYKADNKPLIIIAGKEYGTGSSRDWAAKGPLLLGVKAVITESFERIHRSNLIGMGILPLQFQNGVTRKTLKLDGSESISLEGIETLKPHCSIKATFTRKNGEVFVVDLLCRIDTDNEVSYYCNGGILQYVLRQKNQ